jgi:anti-anti-sigma factor
MVLGDVAVSTATLPYKFDYWMSHGQLRLLPGLNAVPWNDIEKIGTQVLSEVEGKPASGFLIDLSALDYIGSAVVALVVRIWKAVKKEDGKVAVICDNRMVLEVIKIAGLDKVWTIVPTKEAGLKLLGVNEGAGGGSALWILALASAITAVVAAGLYVARSIDPEVAQAVVYGAAGGAVLLGLLSVAMLRGAGRWIGLGSMILGGLGAAGFATKWLETLTR